VIYGVDVQMNETREGTTHGCCAAAFKLYSYERACAWWGDEGRIPSFEETVTWNCIFLLF